MHRAREAHAIQRTGYSHLASTCCRSCPRLQICPHKWQRTLAAREDDSDDTESVLSPPPGPDTRKRLLMDTPRRDGTRTMPHTMPTKRSPSRRRRNLLRLLGRAVSSPTTSPSHLLLGSSQTLTRKECAASGSYTWVTVASARWAGFGYVGIAGSSRCNL